MPSQRLETASHIPREASEIVNSFNSIFGDIKASWYLLGSHADGTAIDLSDVDVLCLSAPLHAEILEWGARAEASYGAKVDLFICHPQSLNTVLQAHLIPMLRHGLLVQGDDLRSTLPQVDLRAYQETVAHLFGKAIEHYHPDRDVSRPPNREDEFLGFVERAKDWTGLSLWTHSVVALIGKAATAVAASEGRLAGSRTEALNVFAECSGAGRWPRFCQDAVQLLRDTWRYRVPEFAPDRRTLRAICGQLCEFEAFCLGIVTTAGIPPFRVNRTPQN